jgi:hypothetical protein
VQNKTKLAGAIMRDHKRKRPNAQKHVVFATCPIIPGEDREEFSELHSALVAEWMPVSATEEDAVFTITKATWRKRRAQNFLEVQLMSNMLDVEIPRLMKPWASADLYASRLFRPDKIQHLKQKFPRSSFKSESKWVLAIINEINVLAPAAPPDSDAPEPLPEDQKLAHDVNEFGEENCEPQTRRALVRSL